MEPYSPKCVGHESYFKKFRTEVNAIKLLTDTVISEIDQTDKGNKALKKKLYPNSDFLCYSTTWADKLVELYSRITTFLQTLSLYISTSSDTQLQLPLHGQISPPTVSALPTVCRMLWKQVHTICRGSDNHNLARTQPQSATSVDVTMASKSNQTENSCLSYCESCQLATGLVKALIDSITEQQKKHYISKTHVSQFRRRVVDEVGGMSQWAAMSGWVEAIQADIKWASDAITSSQTQNQDLLRDLNRTKGEQQSAEKNLRDDLQLVHTQLAAEKAQNTYLRHQIEDLNLSLRRRIEYEQSLQERINNQSKLIQTLQKSIKYLKRDIDSTKIVHESLRDFVKKTLTAEFRTINDMNLNTTKKLQQILDISYSSFNKEAVLKTELTGKNAVVDTLQKKCSTLEQEARLQHENLEKYKATMKQKTVEDNNMKMLEQKVEALEMSLVESRAQELLYKSEIESRTQSQVEFSGDPVRDMETQRQVNKRKMKRLLTENADLKSTIQKLKAMKIKTKSTLQ